jgi:hypothetical protein
MKYTITLRHDTAANWSTCNPTLSAGEFGFETDTQRLKLGTGSTAWNSLAYLPIGSLVPTTSSGAISALTTTQQAQLMAGSLVATTDGKRWLYSGTGSKTAEGSYLLLADSSTEWADIQNRPSTFAPSAHTHTASQVTDFAAAVVAAAPPTTNASLLTQGTLPDARLSGNVVLTTDSRLSNARTPTAHTHTTQQITGEGGAYTLSGADTFLGQLANNGLTDAIDAYGGVSWQSLTDVPTTFAPAAHTHTISEIVGLQTQLNAKATPADVTAAISGVINAAPAALDTLNELAAALGNDANFSATVTNALAAKAPLASPTFTGTVSGISKGMVGLGNVDNTADASKPVSTAQAAANAVVASAAAADATSKASAAQAYAVQRANHTGTQAWSTIVSTPATLAGYGITDGVTTSDARLSDTRTPTDGSVTAAKIAANQSVSFSGVTAGTSGITCNAGTIGTVGGTLRVGSLPANVTVFLVTSAGQVTSGSWMASAVGVSYGGTGATTAADARTNLGLAIGTDVAAASHTHAAGAIASGTIDTARLGSGTASASTYLRGDQTWAAISTYTLPAATVSSLGGVIVGAGLGVSSGTVSVQYGTTSGTACQGSDSRLSDARVPTAHASSHASGGSDAISIAASQITSGTLAAARLPVVLEQSAAVGNSGTATTLSLSSASVQTVTLTGNCTFTMPTVAAGASITLILTQSAAFTASFTGVLWSGGTAPTITATSSKRDILVFVSDGSSWFGTALQNF